MELHVFAFLLELTSVFLYQPSAKSLVSNFLSFFRSFLSYAASRVPHILHHHHLFSALLSPLFFQLSERWKLLFSPTLINKFCLLHVCGPRRDAPSDTKTTRQTADWGRKSWAVYSCYNSSSFHEDFVTYILYFSLVHLPFAASLPDIATISCPCPPSIHLHPRLSPSVLPTSLGLFIHPAGIDLSVHDWMLLPGLDHLNALLLFNLTLIYVRSTRCPCSVVFKKNSLWNLGRAGTAEKPPREAHIKFHQWKTEMNKQSGKKPNRHMVVICCGDWQLLIGLIQPLGPLSSLADLDTAVALSKCWHHDPEESAEGSSEMRATCIREDKWMVLILGHQSG